MTLTLVLAAAALVTVLTVLFGLALIAAAKGADHMDAESGVLATLANVRSPSGRPFFASNEAVQDFVRTLEETRGDPRDWERPGP